jgi:hypothetical protein
MAVKLRCPECRAELKLKTAPEAGTEVECPKCGSSFEAPDTEAENEKAELVKQLKGAKEKEEKEEKTKPAAKGKADDKPAPKQPKRRKAKKRETSKGALIGAICAALFMLITVTATLIWFFNRVPQSVEMLHYVPEDAQSAIGVNVGHALKYPEFYKSVSGAYGGQQFRTAADAIGKAAGKESLEGWVDRVAVATSAANGTTMVFRTKEPFDEAALGKLAGAQKSGTFYNVPNMGRVFAPTPRLVVVASASTPQAVFNRMLTGHGDNKEKTLGTRMGALGAKVTRGTFWRLTMFDTGTRPTAPPKKEGAAGNDDSAAQLAQTTYEAINATKGYGVKASMGSKDVRFELDVWYTEGDKSSSTAKKWKDSELAKGDEGNTPKWFKEAGNTFGDKKVFAQLLNNLSFGTYGDVFYARTSVTMVDLQQSSSAAVGEVLGTRAAQGGFGGPGGVGPVGPAGPGPMGPGVPGGIVGPGGKPRRAIRKVRA